MSPLDVLSLAGEIWPRLVGLVVCLALVFFPHTTASMIVKEAEAKAAQMTSLFEHALLPTSRQSSDGHACHRQVRCTHP